MSRTDWLSEIPRSPDLEVAAIDWDLKGWRRDVRALEVVDILLTPPEESGRRAWPPELLPGIEAWEGLGGRIETDPRVIDLSTWRGPVLDPGIAPSAVSCLPHEIWPAEWRMRGLRAVGILVLVCGVAAFLLRWQRASPALSALGMTAAGAVSVGLSTLVVPPSRATLDVMAVARIGTGARLQGMRLAGPVERLDWLRVAGVPGGSWSPVLPVDAPMRRLWLEPAAASRGPAGTIEGGAGATRWRPAMSTREAPATLEARSLSWEPLPITVARQASPGGAPRWVCTVHDPAFDGAERYLSDGQHIWAWTAGEEAEAAFEWPSPELAVSLWKFAERAQAAEEGEGGFRLRLVAAAVARTPPERRFMLAVPGRTFVERTQEGFLRVRVHPTLWMVEVPEK
ncbi:MAG: hypothetical protein HYY93_02820 [Planctomycetes bacterium]|nr:hypothetical protein [Planctomycetota bacterium]